MKLKRYRHKNARFCMLTEPFIAVVEDSLRWIIYFDVNNNGKNNVDIRYLAIEKTYKVKEIVKLYDGLSLAVTSRGLFIFYSRKDCKRFEMVAVKDEPVKATKIKFLKPYIDKEFSWWNHHATGFETGSFVAEEVDSTFARYNMYIVKSREKYFLCTKM